ncbi:ABC transporter permease [Paenibacillus cymbidii]|uniref:ABC transporter permease n=1 Tax=Paenibacillus cymbidii TaxID=1639034 RepID=UPI0010821946
MGRTIAGMPVPAKRLSKTGKAIWRHWGLYLMLLPPVVYVLVFKYVPMYGIQIAFRDFYPTDGIWGSDWIGIANFERFFSSFVFWRLIRNTLGISIYYLLATFPLPIVLAIGLSELRNRFFQKTAQLVTYAPHFISTVVMVGIIVQFLSPHGGIINNMIVALGGKPINFMGEPAYFKSLYVWSGVWQNVGYSAIIYIAALTGIDPQIHEAAVIDGASKWKRILHIDIPYILPTAVILLILSVGHMMNVGFEKTYLMQNTMNISSSEVISTYVYKVGLLQGDFSYSTAVGLFNSVVNLVLILAVNRAARRFGDTSLW